MRQATVERNTKETKIKLTFNVDGTGTCKSETGVGFFDHMLDGFARHGLFDLDVKVDGDLFVDCHHTIEDTGIVLGNAIKEAVGDKKGIKRYGSCILPMDEALVLCAIDLSGSNNHHIVEAMFKAFAKALDSATMFDERIVGVLSTKETL